MSGGRLGKLRDTRDFIDAVCELGKGNKLVALRCLKKAATEEEMRMPWALSDDRLSEFLESLVELGEDVRAEAVNVADAYGRLHPDKFRQVWNKLREQSGPA